LAGSGLGPVVGFCEHDKPLGSITKQDIF